MTSTVGIFLVSKLWIWLRHLGGPGLLLLGLADNSIIPLPGSMDVLTIWFAVHHHKLWYYYAAMATAGAILGGYITYRLARKGGKTRAKNMTAVQRSEAASKAARARWGKV